MPRILGVDLPKQKRIDIALGYLYGVGRYLALKLLKEANIEPSKRAKDLTEDEVSRITNVLQKSPFKFEGDLRRELSSHIKRLMEIGSYRGSRHRKGLPCRGQRTKTNSRTRKGPRKNMAMVTKKAEPGKK